MEMGRVIAFILVVFCWSLSEVEGQQIAVQGDELRYRSTISGQFITAAAKDSVVNYTLVNGRPVLKFPGADLPVDSHIVLESDYIAARSSGNSYFDTLRLDYGYYNLLKDSIELVLPLFDTSQVKGKAIFNITYFGFDNDSMFFWLTPTSYWKPINNSSRVKVDSSLVPLAQSILYFSRNVYFSTDYNQRPGDESVSNYMSHDHPSGPFRLPRERNGMKSFTLIYDSNKQKYYIQ